MVRGAIGVRGRGRGGAFSIHIVDEHYLYSSVSILSSSLSISSTFKMCDRNWAFECV